VLPAAQSHIAGERKRSRWNRARLSLVVPIGGIVAVAIVCVVIAVLTSARRADEVSLNREQQLLQDSIVGKGAHLLRQVESAAATLQATAKLRDSFDAQWADRRIGKWLQNFYHQDVVVIVDGGDRIKYSLFRSPGDAVAGDLGKQIKTSLDLLRGRLDAVPEHAVAVDAKQDPAKPGRSTALIQRFLDRPAIVGAVAVGAEPDLAAGNAQAPIVFSVRYIDGALLQEIGERLQLSHLRRIEDPVLPAGEHAIEFADAQGNAVARFAWTPTRPGGTIVGSVLPFIGVALGGFALLAISPCTIRSAACPTASISASGSKP
jgi:sensor domain CHASE-containing protein